LSEVSGPTGKTAISVADLFRLNEEVKKLREDIAKRRSALQRITPDQRAKIPSIDLIMETGKLNDILLGLAKVAEWLKAATVAKASPDRSSELNLVQKTLLQMRNDLESEKGMREEKIAKLVQELTLQHDEVKMLRDEIVRAIESLQKPRAIASERRSIEPYLGKQQTEIEELKVSPSEGGQRKTIMESHERKRVGVMKRELQALRRELDSERKALQTFRVNISQEKRSLVVKGKALEKALKRIDMERKTIREEKRELRQKRLAISMMKSEQERRNLEREQELEKDREEVDRREDITLKIRDELRFELHQLIDLGKHLLEVNKENEREHRRLSNEWSKLAKTVVNLEREKRRLANRSLLPRTERRRRSSSRTSNKKKLTKKRAKRVIRRKKSTPE
jgi:hypothetical protein